MPGNYLAGSDVFTVQSSAYTSQSNPRCEIDPVRIALSCSVVLLVVTICQARDCSVSKEFQLKQPQVLAGVLQDPVGAVLPGIELELLSEKKVVQHLWTNNQGAFNFGELAVGRYRIHVRHGFCVPKVPCRTEGCSLAPTLTPDSKNIITVN